MHPDLIRIGNFALHSFGLMMALGFLAALGVWKRLSRGGGRTVDMLSSLLGWMMICGLVGARLAYVAENWAEFAHEPLGIVRLDRGGLVYYGGVLGAGVGLVVFSRRHHESLIDLLDLVLVALPLGHAFGRIGCFLNGCCFGAPCPAGIGIRFPRRSLPWMEHWSLGLIRPDSPYSLPVYPTQLIEAFGNLLIFLLLYRLYGHRRFRGQVAGIYLLCYPLLRFGVEALRGDPRMHVGVLSIAQVLSIPLLLLGVFLLACGAAGKTGKPTPRDEATV